MDRMLNNSEKTKEQKSKNEIPVLAMSGKFISSAKLEQYSFKLKWNWFNSHAKDTVIVINLVYCLIFICTGFFEVTSEVCCFKKGGLMDSL